MRKHIEQLEMNLANSNEENEQLKQRLSTTLSRIDILKTTNQVRRFNIYISLIYVSFIETYE